MSRLLATEWPSIWSFHAGSRSFDFENHSGDSDAPDRARWVLTLGIVSLLISPLGIYAWMAGNACLKAISDGRMDPTCESNARAGRILGLVAIGMFAFKVTVLLPTAVYFWLL